jgi:hypothetical protein
MASFYTKISLEECVTFDESCLEDILEKVQDKTIVTANDICAYLDNKGSFRNYEQLVDTEVSLPGMKLQSEDGTEIYSETYDVWVYSLVFPYAYDHICPHVHLTTNFHEILNEIRTQFREHSKTIAERLKDHLYKLRLWISFNRQLARIENPDLFSHIIEIREKMEENQMFYDEIRFTLNRIKIDV